MVDVERVASVRAPELREVDGRASAREATRRLAATLLAGSPRVMAAGPGLVRADARGWERRGGGEALGRALREAARQAGFEVGVGVADTPVAADAAAALAAEDAGGEARAEGERPTDGPGGGSGDAAPPARDGAPGILVVPPGEARAFLAPLPPELLPLPGGVRETLRALDVRRIGWLAEREPAELEARLGPEGLRAARWARGEDDRLFRALSPEDPPEVRMELEGPARTVEPLLFVLRHLLARLCDDLAGEGRHAARLRLGLKPEEGDERTVTVAPARPTLREGLLLELCRAGLEREADGGRLPGAVVAVSLAAVERAAAPVRQEDLFAGETRDPADAAGVLSRLRARLGEGSVVRPRTRPGHRPEARSGWEPAELEVKGAASAAACEPERSGTGRRPGPPRSPREAAASPSPGAASIPSVLRLLPEPRQVAVRCEDGRPAALLEEGALREIVAVEGPERLSGDGWERPYRREYFRACTEEGELLWLFRTWRRRGRGGGAEGDRGRRGPGADGDGVGRGGRGPGAGEEPGPGAGGAPGSEEVWRLHGWWD